MSGTRLARIEGKRRFNSSVSPEKERARTTSRGVIMPKSPCMPSEGCTKVDGVPVEARVAVIFRPINPDFPTPRTTTRPLHRVMRWMASAKRWLTQAPWARTVSASSRITARTRFKSAASETTAMGALLGGMRLLMRMHPGRRFSRKLPHIGLQDRLSDKKEDDQDGIDGPQRSGMPRPGGLPKRRDLEIGAALAAELGVVLVVDLALRTFHLGLPVSLRWPWPSATRSPFGDRADGLLAALSRVCINFRKAGTSRKARLLGPSESAWSGWGWTSQKRPA